MLLNNYLMINVCHKYIFFQFFRGFKSPGLDIYNCLNVRITDTRFIANNVSTFNDRYRADAAGLSIAYQFQRRPFSNPTLLIKNCEFNNNHAAVSSDLSDQIDKALNDNSYPARGGGLGIIITEEYANVTVLVEECLFLENYAEAFGGAFYLSKICAKKLKPCMRLFYVIFHRNVFIVKVNICTVYSP